MKKNKKNNTSSAQYTTYALADINKVDPETNNTIPSDEAVEIAREWVNFNEK